MPVIEAARLCDRAQGGQILAQELVAHLAGGRHEHAFKAIGELELKGLPEPLEAVEVGWEPLGDERPSLPLPPRLSEMPPGGFVGRAAERMRLRELFEERVEAECRVWRSSPASRGSARRAFPPTPRSRHGRKARACSTAAATRSSRLPMGPGSRPSPTTSSTLRRPCFGPTSSTHGGELTRLVPVLGERSPTPPHRARPIPTPSATCFRRGGRPLARGLERRAARARARRPALGGQADASALEARRLPRARACTRSSSAPIATPISPAGTRCRRCSPTCTANRGSSGSRSRGSRSPTSSGSWSAPPGTSSTRPAFDCPSSSFCETDGNPFYTGELLRHLTESGTLYQQDGGRWAVRGALSELGLPQSVHEVLGRRIDRLGRGCARGALRRGRDRARLRRGPLLQVTEDSDDELLELLERGSRRLGPHRVRKRPRALLFAHALINHSLYEDLGTTRRARLHRRIGRPWRSFGWRAGSARLGARYHWAKAAPSTLQGDRLRAPAGERALEELGPDEALRWFQQALELQAQRVERSIQPSAATF